MSHCSVYITAPNRDEALAIGRALVAARLAACANLFDGVHSVYWWEGTLEEADEVVLIAKTRSALLDEIITKVKSLHSDSCPCIVAWPIAAGNPDYLDWIDAETAAP